MQLPSIARGKRITLPRPVGSADSLLLARHAQARAASGQRVAIVTAEPADVPRLAEEIAFFAPELRVATFPDWETLPYDRLSPHQDLVSERLATLWRLHGRDLDVLLLAASTAVMRIAPPSFIAATTFFFKHKTRLDEAALKSQLTLAGYTHVSQVVSPGEYAVRGGLIDLFPMGSPVPYRVDLFGDEVDSIRTFDPDTQRSLYPVPEVRLLPGREFPIDEASRNAFRSRWREKLCKNHDEIRSLGYEEPFLRLWEYYLCTCQAAFAERYVSDVQLVLARPAARDARRSRTAPRAAWGRRECRARQRSCTIARLLRSAIQSARRSS